MSDDELLYALGDALRDGPDLQDELWDRLAADQVGDDELAQLRASDDPEIQAALAAFAPLDDAMYDRLEQVVLDAPRLDEAPAAPERPPAKVLVFPKRRWAMGAGLAVALAAALAFFVLRPTGGPALPSYQLELLGGDKPVRSATSAPAARPLFRADSVVQLTLRPAQQVVGEVMPTAFLVQGDAERRLPDVFTVAKSGAVTFDGPARRLFGDTPGGDYELVILLTAPDTAPSKTSDPGERVAQPVRWQP